MTFTFLIASTLAGAFVGWKAAGDDKPARPRWVALGALGGLCAGLSGVYGRRG